MRLDELISGFEITTLSAPCDTWPLITSVTLDLEEVCDGALFIARRLWYSDTHAQIDEAISRGAVAVLVSQIDSAERQRDDTRYVPIMYTEHEDPTLGLLCDRFYGQPTAQLKVYGVTGTNGKTSAVSYLAELLRVAGERVMVIGTVEYRFEDRVIPAPNTTPDALVIHRLARQALDLGATALALEVSSHALSLWRVAGLSFDAVGFTSWGRDHLDFHGTLEAYRDAKGMLFDVCLKYSISKGKTPVAVAHADEPGLDMLSRTPKGVRCVRCEVGALTSKSVTQPHGALSVLCLHAVEKPSIHGVTLAGAWTHVNGSEALEARALPLIGDYHPSNLAIALGMVLGTHPDRCYAIWEALTHTRGVPGRMERVIFSSEIQDRARGRVALIDYAHTPDAIKRALEAVRAVHHGAIHVVIGCGGNRDRGKRPEMIRAALLNADMVWLTSDNPRDESPEQIIEDALQLGSAWSARIAEVRVEIDRRTCLERAWRELPSHGALLVTGKGHEDYQEIGARRFRLLDTEAVRAAAWSEYHQITLRDVPFTASMTHDWSTCNVTQSLVALLIEARGRRGGLSLFLVDQVELTTTESYLSTSIREEMIIISAFESQEAQVSRVPLELDRAEHTSLESEKRDILLEGLWLTLSTRLTPRMRSILWVAESQTQLSHLEQGAERLVQLISATHPHPTLPVYFGLSKLAEVATLRGDPGGWPKLRRGPKIPSLLI